MPLKIILTLLIATVAFSNVKLPSVIGNGMVLQQNSAVTLWGWAEPGEAISVRASWNKDTLRTVADGWTRWKITIPTPPADNLPHEMTITGHDTVVLGNILIGEVWLCSGQSNMEWSAARGFDNAEEEVRQADFPKIRFFGVEKGASEYPQENCRGSWSVCSPATMRTFSATAYFFGRELHHALGIPVGLINSSWGGTGAEVWTRYDSIAADPELFEKSKLYPYSTWKPVRPGALFNAMIAPLVPFEIAGVIWYQGEENVRVPRTYPKLFRTLVNQWRSEWKKEFPFYYVQIAPYEGYEPLRGAALRDAQRQCMAIPNVGMAVISDIGDIHDIHPGNKQDVGKRLAAWALAKTYGKNEIAYSGPLYKSMKTEGDKIRISFTHADNGLMTKGGDPDHFEIAGPDGKFYQARAKIKGNDIIAWNDRVKNPAAVRFAWSNTAEPNLFNKEGLPASTFRTDDWEIIYERVTVTPAVDFEKNSVTISLACPDSNLGIRYTLDGSTPSLSSEIYSDPLNLNESTTLRAGAFHHASSGPPVIWKFLKHKGWGKPVALNQKYQARYAGPNKDKSLVDGMCGTDSYMDGMWQGYEGNDLDITVDLGKNEDISNLSVSFLHDQASWIFLPSAVVYSVSDDARNFRKIAEIENDFPANSAGKVIKEFGKKVKLNARYINVKAENIGVIPGWHKGRGGKPWIFADEIIIY